MNPLALYLASGESLYAGSVLLLAVMVAERLFRNKWLARLRMLLVWVGLALMAMACPPFPFWVDGVFGVVFGAWLFLAPEKPGTPAQSRRRPWRLGVTAALAVLLVLLPALEIPYRLRPTFSGPKADHVVVIGDSISAGIGAEVPWPGVLALEAGLPVKNFSRAGDGAADVLAGARKLKDDDRLVLVEIGGNDLIAGVSSADFERDLEALLAACSAPRRMVIMFELPLLPHRIAYGQIQRRLAAKYHVGLIPKRYFIAVIGGHDATSDGLHLNPAGAERMAALVKELLEPILQPPAGAGRPAEAPTSGSGRGQ